MRSLVKLTCRFAITVLLFLPLGVLAQTQDPLIGTWNESGGPGDGTISFIAVMSFNVGGTTVEFDTGGANSSASPGESINLGKWNKTGKRTYTLKNQNYIYDASGSLADVNITVCKVTLDAGLNSFSGSCNFNFYTCSLTVCPGTLIGGPFPATISGTRF